MYRIIIVTTPVSAPKNWKHEGNLLLPWKLARYLAIHLPAHVYLLIADEGENVDFFPPADRVTIRLGESLSPAKTVVNLGKPVSVRAAAEAIKEIGPDAVICLNTRMTGMLSLLFEADKMRRGGAVHIPLILWEGTPTGYDIVEAGSHSAGVMNAAGYVGADQVWCFSLSHGKAIQTEVTRSFGFSQAQKLMEKLRVMSIVIDSEYMRDNIRPDIPKRDKFTVHIGGRWSRTKGYPLVAKAVTKLQAMGEDIALLNTGMESMNPPMKQAIAECGMEMITGLTQEAMWEVAASCHVGVLAQDAQAVPALALEQLALGLPLLVRSTPRMQDVLPKYPLVWTDINELMALIIEVRDDYEGAKAKTAAWFAEYGHLFDLASSLPTVRDALQQREWTSVAIKFDTGGIVTIAPRGTTMIAFNESLFSTTMARREAHRFPEKFTEVLDNPLPVFELAEPVGEEDGETTQEEDTQDDE